MEKTPPPSGCCISGPGLQPVTPDGETWIDFQPSRLPAACNSDWLLFLLNIAMLLLICILEEKVSFQFSSLTQQAVTFLFLLKQIQRWMDYSLGRCFAKVHSLCLMFLLIHGHVNSRHFYSSTDKKKWACIFIKAELTFVPHTVCNIFYFAQVSNDDWTLGQKWEQSLFVTCLYFQVCK